MVKIENPRKKSITSNLCSITVIYLIQLFNSSGEANQTNHIIQILYIWYNKHISSQGSNISSHRKQEKDSQFSCILNIYPSHSICRKKGNRNNEAITNLFIYFIFFAQKYAYNCNLQCKSQDFTLPIVFNKIVLYLCIPLLYLITNHY